jgi:NAD(P)-dependent dehydrogenase (short-subunit alcohol dehydrogenase family)
MVDLARQVAADEFAGSTALIAGGSRGLGAVTAKAVAAGGGQVILTYASGREDAERLRDEIVAERGVSACRVLEFDATQTVEPQLGALKGIASHLYYFATPRIHVPKGEPFVPSLFGQFIRVYVDAFYETCRALLGERLAVLYPSTSFVDERPRGFAEYAMAKAAGEALCAYLYDGTSGLRILVERLPRVRTDQTASVTPVKAADPVEVMLPIIRRLHRGV